MLQDRDQKFFLGLFLALLCVLVLFRLLLMFAGVDLDIPYVDTFIKTIFNIVGSISRAIANSIGKWVG